MVELGAAINGEDRDEPLAVVGLFDQCKHRSGVDASALMTSLEQSRSYRVLVAAAEAVRLVLWTPAGTLDHGARS